MSGETSGRRGAAAGRQTLMTMSDIARMAGVSESTVSRALSGSPLVAESTRERIVELAEEANFSVNQQARGLALGRTHTIEAIFPIQQGTLQQVSDPFFVDMLAGLTDEFAARDYDVLLSKSTPWDADRPGCAYLGGRADAVIFVGQGRYSAQIRDFARAHGPVVAWGAVNDGDDCCTVGSDNCGGGRAAMAHLHKRGRSSVVFMGDTSLPEIAQRFEGYRQALEAGGKSVEDSHVLSAPFDIALAKEAAHALLRLYPDFDAIFAASDMMAMAAIVTLREAGIRVPEDVAVIGFDDIAAAAYVNPALTTVHQDIRGAARVIAAKVLDILDGKSVSSEVLPTELVVRQSCGANAGLP